MQKDPGLARRMLEIALAALKAYEARSVPENARLPFDGALASIRQNRHIAGHAMPEITRWVSVQVHQ